MKSKPNPIIGLSILATTIALVTMPVDKGRPLYNRLVDLSSEMAFGSNKEIEKGK